jgi:REP element-mobilizing transposase RayT
MTIMSGNSERHHRHSIRLKGYDYSQAGVYYITICIQERLLLLEPEPVHLMVERWWTELSTKFPTVETDAFTIMPNHVHGIVAIIGHEDDQQSPLASAARPTLGTIVQWYKTMTTNEYIRAVKENGWQPFHGRLWQRNYWEHIIRDDGDLARLRRYIETNPSRWIEDSLHP